MSSLNESSIMTNPLSNLVLLRCVPFVSSVRCSKQNRHNTYDLTDKVRHGPCALYVYHPTVMKIDGRYRLDRLSVVWHAAKVVLNRQPLLLLHCQRCYDEIENDLICRFISPILFNIGTCSQTFYQAQSQSCATSPAKYAPTLSYHCRDFYDFKLSHKWSFKRPSLHSSNFWRQIYKFQLIVQTHMHDCFIFTS